MTGGTRRLLRVVAVAFAMVVVWPVASAMADEPHVTITSPTNGSVSSETPSISGTGDPEPEDGGPVTLTIHEGPTAAGAVVQGPFTPAQVTTPENDSGTWSQALPALPPGTYTALATQTTTPLPEFEERQLTAEASVTFTVSGQVSGPPTAETGPASSITQGSASLNATVNPNGETVSDCHFAYGTTTAYGHSVPCASAPGSGTAPVVVSASVGGLSASTTYHFRILATNIGGTGEGSDRTFTAAPSLIAPGGPAGPLASFTWFPAVPEVGQNISLVSTSTDSTSPLTTFAWAPAGVFHTGGPLLSTSFSTPGGHVVKLRVTDANGLSSVASQTIQVTSAPLVLMQPFPIVRIAGSETFSGVRLRLLTALAPIGSRITVSCRGRSCPAKSEGRVAFSRKRSSGTVIVEFRQFERSLRAGVILEIRITRPGQIGKFTRFAVRRGKLPVRVDTCLDAAGVSPLTCPTS